MASVAAAIAFGEGPSTFSLKPMRRAPSGKPIEKSYSSAARASAVLGKATAPSSVGGAPAVSEVRARNWRRDRVIRCSQHAAATVVSDIDRDPAPPQDKLHIRI